MVDLLGFILIPDILPLDFMVLSAVRALGFPAFHRPFGIAVRNRADILDSGGADLHRLSVVERGLAGHCQPPGVALVSGGRGPTVPLVTQHIPDRLRRQGVGLGRAAHGQDTAGVSLLKHRVPAIPALGRGHFPAQRGTIPNHWRNTELGILFSVNGSGMNVENTAWVLVDDVADNIIF